MEIINSNWGFDLQFSDTVAIRQIEGQIGKNWGICRTRIGDFIQAISSPSRGQQVDTSKLGVSCPSGFKPRLQPATVRCSCFRHRSIVWVPSRIPGNQETATISHQPCPPFISFLAICSGVGLRLHSSMAELREDLPLFTRNSTAARPIEFRNMPEPLVAPVDVMDC